MGSNSDKNHNTERKNLSTANIQLSSVVITNEKKTIIKTKVSLYFC